MAQETAQHVDVNTEGGGEDSLCAASSILPTGTTALVCSMSVTILIVLFYGTSVPQLENVQSMWLAPTQLTQPVDQIISMKIKNIERNRQMASSFTLFPTSDPIINSSQRTIYSQIRNITFEANASSPWPMYRLGDMFKKYKFRRQRLGWRFHHRHFNSSIAVEYMDRIENPLNTTEGNANYSTMIQIVNERIERNKTLQFMLPDNKTLVVHLRTGDVIDTRGNKFLPNDIPVQTYLNFNVQTSKGITYTRGLPFYSKMWDQIQSKGIQIDRVLVITGWHHEISHVRSIAYINAVIKHFEKMVDRVDIRVNKNPDEDVIIMSRSKYFVQSGGGFSRMIAGLVARNGGTVFNEVDSANTFCCK